MSEYVEIELSPNSEVFKVEPIEYGSKANKLFNTCEKCDEILETKENLKNHICRSDVAIKAELKIA